MDTTGNKPDPEQIEPVVGLLAFSSLAAMTRLAKDGDQAPTTQYQVDLATLASRGFKQFSEFDRYAQEKGFSLVEAIAPYSGLFDELDQRTRPSNWWERAVKTYVVMGVFTDLFSEISKRHQVFETDPGVWDFGHGQWIREHLAPLTQGDDQLASRLSLWARRVAGETLGLARATLFSYPELVPDAQVADEVMALAASQHNERMEAVNLKP